MQRWVLWVCTAGLRALRRLKSAVGEQLLLGCLPAAHVCCSGNNNAAVSMLLPAR